MVTTRVLVVDDSALVREALRRGLCADPTIEVVGTAGDPYEARDMLVQLRPDVMTLDVEMPRMDGIEFLRRLMPRFPIPVVMVSSRTTRGAETTLQALAAGAIDFVTKPSTSRGGGLEAMMSELRTKVKIASMANMSVWKQRGESLPPSVMRGRELAAAKDKLIALGASTGGTDATKRVLARLPTSSPGVVIVQHMPAGFTGMYANSLNEMFPLHIKEAAHHDRVLPGHVLIAPGDRQLRVVRSGGEYLVELGGRNPVGGHCPAVDVMMDSVAEHAGANASGIILTGMGRDGAQGLLAMRTAGAGTVAQDQATSVVYGMPRAARDNGAAMAVLPLDSIADWAVAHLCGPASPRKSRAG